MCHPPTFQCFGLATTFCPKSRTKRSILVSRLVHFQSIFWSSYFLQKMCLWEKIGVFSDFLLDHEKFIQNPSFLCHRRMRVCAMRRMLARSLKLNMQADNHISIWSITSKMTQSSKSPVRNHQCPKILPWRIGVIGKLMILLECKNLIFKLIIRYQDNLQH